MWAPDAPPTTLGGPGVPERGGRPPAVRDALELRFDGLDGFDVAFPGGGEGLFLEVHPRHAVRERVGEKEGEHGQHQVERAIGPEETAFVSQDGAQGHGYATSARHTRQAAARNAPTNHSPSMARDRVRLCSIHPSEGASYLEGRNLGPSVRRGDVGLSDAGVLRQVAIHPAHEIPPVLLRRRSEVPVLLDVGSGKSHGEGAHREQRRRDGDGLVNRMEKRGFCFLVGAEKADILYSIGRNRIHGGL